MEPKAKYQHATDGTQVIFQDPYLEPHEEALKGRYSFFRHNLDNIEKHEGSLERFADSYKTFGVVPFQDPDTKQTGALVQEWAPLAHEVYLVGDFNRWDEWSHPCKKDDFGHWKLFLPDDAHTGKPAIAHGSRIKLRIKGANNEYFFRIPAYARYVKQEIVDQEKRTWEYNCLFWDPKQDKTQHVWAHDDAIQKNPLDLRIYEVHIGMSSSEGKTNTYSDFRQHILPMIHKLGYNAIQIMAVMEHSYYASFGYQVTNFFASSSRFGTPEDLKALIDEAHRMGMIVLLDIVHSHASKNISDGINEFDGSDSCFFHAGARGYHEAWDTRLFNYCNFEVLRFLLGNIKMWADEFHFDGFRFDGVTSMLYKHHGLGTGFSGGYHEYFGGEADGEAIAYLTLANELIHRLTTANSSTKRGLISIAEDVSGMPCLCRPVSEGGVGFDYRLGMAIPDKWIQLLKEFKDEDWNIGNIVYTLTNRRYLEKTISYCESHDQSLVGDKTLAFWLMDKEMYTEMTILNPITPVVARGIALHKMIRLLTCGLGGEGYLNFMGNEFGHPEWVDFPCERNGNSYHHARRQWNLAFDPLLRYQHLYAFDKEMQTLEEQYKWLAAGPGFVSVKHEDDKVIIFERGSVVFVFNFHPTKSFTHYPVPVATPGKYKIVLNSDETRFGGHSLIHDSQDQRFFSSPASHASRPHTFQIYIPSRVVLLFSLAE